MEHALRDQNFASLQNRMREDKPADAIVGKAVESLRTAADSPAAHNAIGKECSSIVPLNNPEESGWPGPKKY